MKLISGSLRIIIYGNTITQVVHLFNVLPAYKHRCNTYCKTLSINYYFTTYVIYVFLCTRFSVYTRGLMREYYIIGFITLPPPVCTAPP